MPFAPRSPELASDVAELRHVLEGAPATKARLVRVLLYAVRGRSPEARAAQDLVREALEAIGAASAPRRPAMTLAAHLGQTLRIELEKRAIESAAE